MAINKTRCDNKLEAFNRSWFKLVPSWDIFQSCHKTCSCQLYILRFLFVHGSIILRTRRSSHCQRHHSGSTTNAHCMITLFELLCSSLLRASTIYSFLSRASDELALVVFWISLNYQCHRRTQSDLSSIWVAWLDNTVEMKKVNFGSLWRKRGFKGVSPLVRVMGLVF